MTSEPFFIRSKLASKQGKHLFLDLYNKKAVDGGYTVLDEFHGGLSQQWHYHHEYGLVRSAANTGLCLDIKSNYYAVVRYYDGTATQEWRYDPLHKFLIHKSTGKALDVEGEKNNKGTYVIYYSLHGRANQVWYLISASHLLPKPQQVPVQPVRQTIVQSQSVFTEISTTTNHSSQTPAVESTTKISTPSPVFVQPSMPKLEEVEKLLGRNHTAFKVFNRLTYMAQQSILGRYALPDWFETFSRQGNSSSKELFIKNNEKTEESLGGKAGVSGKTVLGEVGVKGGGKSSNNHDTDSTSLVQTTELEMFVIKLQEYALTDHKCLSDELRRDILFLKASPSETSCKEFFRKYGTKVCTELVFGGRRTVTVTAHNETSSKLNSLQMKAMVEAQLSKIMGIVTFGTPLSGIAMVDKLNASVKAEAGLDSSSDRTYGSSHVDIEVVYEGGAIDTKSLTISTSKKGDYGNVVDVAAEKKWATAENLLLHPCLLRQTYTPITKILVDSGWLGFGALYDQMNRVAEEIETHREVKKTFANCIMIQGERLFCGDLTVYNTSRLEFHGISLEDWNQGKSPKQTSASLGNITHVRLIKGDMSSKFTKIEFVSKSEKKHFYMGYQDANEERKKTMKYAVPFAWVATGIIGAVITAAIVEKQASVKIHTAVLEKTSEAFKSMQESSFPFKFEHLPMLK